jgi:excisionase family DNA binding protein
MASWAEVWRMAVIMTPLSFPITDSPRVLGMSDDTVREIIRSGKLTAYQSGRKTLILYADATAYILSLPKVADKLADKPRKPRQKRSK